MKKIYFLFFLCFNIAAYAQAPLLADDFSYTAGDALTDHGWNAHSGGTTNPVSVTSPGLSFTGYVGSNIGLAAGVLNNGQDVNKLFYEQTVPGSVYASFMVNSASNTTSGGYFFHFFDPNQSSAFRARTFIKPKQGKMLIGFSFNASAFIDSSATLLNFGETYLFVVKYTIVAGAENDNVSLYVFKAGDDMTSEPATPTIGPLTATHTTPTDPMTPLGPDIVPAGIALRQFVNLEGITVDGFRVKNNWELTTDVAAARTVSATELTIAAPASSTQTFDITSNASWEALSDQTWLTLSPGSGYGNATVTATAEENMTSAARTATITVTGSGVADQTITVTQDAMAPAALTLPIDFEAASYNFVDFSGGVATVIANPQSSGINTSAKVAQMVRNVGDVWAGSKLMLSANIDFSAASTFSMKVFSTRAGVPVLFKLEGDGGASAETSVNTTVANEWETLQWSFEGKPSNTYNYLTFMFDYGTVGDGTANSTFLFDDVQLINTTGVSNTRKSNIAIYPNPVKTNLFIKGSSQDAEITIFDMTGKKVISKQLNNGTVNTSDLTKGIYMIRIVDKNGVTSKKLVKD